MAVSMTKQAMPGAMVGAQPAAILLRAALHTLPPQGGKPNTVTDLGSAIAEHYNA